MLAWTTKRTSGLSMPMPNADVATTDLDLAGQEPGVHLLALGRLEARVVGRAACGRAP
jgi:hypothetical protein